MTLVARRGERERERRRVRREAETAAAEITACDGSRSDCVGQVRRGRGAVAGNGKEGD